MIVTEFYKGQGLGNQLACYVTTRVIAADKKYKFGIKSPENFKALDFMNVDFGERITGGSGKEGGPPTTLPEGIKNYYAERKIIHPINGADIRTYDPLLVNIPDNTKIDGLMQDEQYMLHRKGEIKKWLKVRPEFECYDYADDNTCVINFRGGEYATHKEFFLGKNYWENAIKKMREKNHNFRFIVITDDPYIAKKFFPDFGVFHFSIAKDYSIIKNAHYLILSNSSFAWFPAWLSDNLKFCIAPRYWGRHNYSDGYWSLGYNITQGWHYLDREGNLSSYEMCKSDLELYMENHRNLYTVSRKELLTKDTKVNLSKWSVIKKACPLWIKNLIKSLINEAKNFVSKIRHPFELYAEKKRKKIWLSNLENAKYRNKIKVYDVFTFFNELDLLEIRLNILDKFVDYFVIIEATETFSGLPKKLFYHENKQLFSKWSHKIIHHVTTDTPKNELDLRKRLENQNLPEIDKIIIQNALTSDNVPPGSVHWLKEFYQKESIKKALTNLKNNDFCFVSDVDEIWNPERFVDFSKNDIFKYKMDPYIYYLNNRSNEDWSGWTGTIATKYENIKDSCLNHLRTARKTKYTVIKDGGWHFSFQGGPEQIMKKIESYGHQELNTEKIKSKINEKIEKNKDIRGRYIRFWTDENKLPRYILENREKYKKMFK